MTMYDYVAKLKEDKIILQEALRKAVEDYGKPGGPWNVPNEPGTWYAMATEALERTK